ncbi:MAG TPA: Usg family protein [Kiloniellales bacterium]
MSQALDEDFREYEEDLQDYRLTTAEILYHMPQFPDLLQSYLWQSLDRVPDFPKLNSFLERWEGRLEGKLHSVRIGYVGIIHPMDWRFTDCVPAMH